MVLAFVAFIFPFRFRVALYLFAFRFRVAFGFAFATGICRLLPRSSTPSNTARGRVQGLLPALMPLPQQSLLLQLLKCQTPVLMLLAY